MKKIDEIIEKFENDELFGKTKKFITRCSKKQLTSKNKKKNKAIDEIIV